jgi:RecB family exonuclease
LKKLEFNEDVGLTKSQMKKLDILPEVESKIECITYNGIKLYGIIDSFELNYTQGIAKFQEYKTGRIPWTQALVDSDEQTMFYAYMI